MMRKTAKCECSPKAYFDKSPVFENDSVTWVWKCTNCGHTKPLGKKRASAKRVKAVIDQIHRAVTASGTEAYPTVIERWETETTNQGDTILTVAAYQGPENSALRHASWRLLGICITKAGGIRVYSDSKSKTGTKGIEKQLRQGRLYVW
jgi:hypothetical protein